MAFFVARSPWGQKGSEPWSSKGLHCEGMPWRAPEGWQSPTARTSEARVRRSAAECSGPGAGRQGT
eukprot:2275799-Alexandrium_andersonii.AAC.1